MYHRGRELGGTSNRSEAWHRKTRAHQVHLTPCEDGSVSKGRRSFIPFDPLDRQGRIASDPSRRSGTQQGVAPRPSARRKENALVADSNDPVPDDSATGVDARRNRYLDSVQPSVARLSALPVQGVEVGRRKNPVGEPSQVKGVLAFTLHTFPARPFGLARFGQCGVDGLDLAAAFVVPNHDAGARDA